MSASRTAAALALALMVCLAPLPALAGLRVVIVEGLGGEPGYSREFDAEARALAAAGRTLTSPANVHVLAGPSASRASVLAYFHALVHATGRDDRLIVYLVGHGSYDGRQYKFNLPGPDLTDRDIAGMLDALPMREQLVVATGSCSGALLGPLARPHRVLITATRNGDEKNATRFGDAFAAALISAEADSDKNGAISAREAYDYANRRVQDYFRRQILLASEHAVLQGDDGGLFTVAALRASGAAGGAAAPGAGAAAVGEGAVAGAPPALLRRREQLNASIAALEQRKGEMPPDQYSARLEQLLVQLAEVQQRIDRSRSAGQGSAGQGSAGQGGADPGGVGQGGVGAGGDAHAQP
ncbi:MAG TPA: C13 family peptidase [Steroidobacteraceae bacterium]|nr:C13 family peptidase [Steroidobacteraceae bacterium]